MFTGGDVFTSPFCHQIHWIRLRNIPNTTRSERGVITDVQAPKNWEEFFPFYGKRSEVYEDLYGKVYLRRAEKES